MAVPADKDDTSNGDLYSRFAQAARDGRLAALPKGELMGFWRGRDEIIRGLAGDTGAASILARLEGLAVEEPPLPDTHEVNAGFLPLKAVHHAADCIQCDTKPCSVGKVRREAPSMGGCPVQIDIPRFILQLREGKIFEAWKVLMERDNLPAVTGRVCPQEVQCQLSCSTAIRDLPVEIGRLERFVADYVWENEPERVLDYVRSLRSSRGGRETKGHAVAVIGSGPAGLTVAADLAVLGYRVTIFESLHVPGGVLAYGIPEFRLPASILRRELKIIDALGVRIVTNVTIGRTMTIKDLFDGGFSAVFIGTGAGLPRLMGIPGESLSGVYSANELLVRLNLLKAYHSDFDTPVRIGASTVVVGGGFTAIDAARWAKRISGGKVAIVYRRSREEMPARAEEVENAIHEGVDLRLLTSPVEILGDGKGGVRAVKCVRMELGKPDASGRRRPSPIPGSEFEIEAQTVVTALGTTPNPILLETTEGLQGGRGGTIAVRDPETGETTLPLTFAGGDAVTGAATVILAMGAGKKAAASIHQSLSGRKADPLAIKRARALTDLASRPFTVLTHRRIVPDVYEMVVEAPLVARACRPGQFVIVMCGENSERIPLTIADWDRERGTVTLVYQVVGKSTADFERMKEGESLLAFSGPLGTRSAIERMDGTVLFVAGGVGLAAVFPILRGHKEAGNRVKLVYGSRSAPYLFWLDRVREVVGEENIIIATDDGSAGEKGLVTEVIKRRILGRDAIPQAIVIGPAIMMRETAKVTLADGINTIVSLNPLMLDGTAMCGGCRVPNRKGETGPGAFACHRGPDRDAAEVDLDALLDRQRIYQNEERAALLHHLLHALRRALPARATGS